MIKYYREITDTEEKILNHDLLDIEDWINKAIEGKINNCMKRLAIAERDRLVASGAKTIPAQFIDLCNSAFECKEYKNRTEREASTATITGL